MKNKLGYLCLLIASMVLVAISLSACSNPAKENFYFIFRYGVEYKNVLDTFNQTYTKDLVKDGTITIALKLSQDELDEIYNDMVDIGIRDYKGMHQGVITEPHTGYKLEIHMNGEQIIIDWIGGFRGGTKDRDIMKLVTRIQEMLESKDEYKNLPEANGAYE